MTDMPKYSVIMTTYNRAAYLRKAVDSVLGQTYRDFEVIVCNDGSTDETSAILESYGGRIRTWHGPNRGTGVGLNAALSLAQGAFVSILDSDDFWMPWTLERVDGVVCTTEQPACVYLCPTYFTDGSVPDLPALPGAASFRVFDSYAAAPAHVPDGNGMLGALPRQLITAAGGFWEGREPCLDTDLILRLSRKMRYVCLDAPATVCVRQHAGRSMRMAKKRFQGATKVMDNHRCGMHGHGLDDTAVAARVARIGISASIEMAAQFGAWRESASLFRRTLRLLPLRRVPIATVWYGGHLSAIMASRLLEKFSRYCTRHLSSCRSLVNGETPPFRESA
jgi:hypothetical protein